MPDYALELSLTPDDEAAVVTQWEALRAAGLPSQADHKGMTNAPHVTLAVAATIPGSAAQLAHAHLAPLLPTELVVRGLLVLGTSARVTLAHLVEPASAVAEANHLVRQAIPSLRHPVWTPHLTLARRVPRAEVARALDVLSDIPLPGTLTASRLRWWDPQQGTIDELT